MCGIIGYKGHNNGCSVVIEGLKNLEYRGYDSWGFCYASKGKLKVIKKVGKIGDFSPKKLPGAEVCVAHCRWATHGNVTIDNAHPILSKNKKIAVVHNGIIENYQGLKSFLSKKGYKFKSQTDTETISMLIELEMSKGKKFKTAVFSAIKKLKGRYAFLAFNSESQDIIAVRNGSPLVLGIGKNEFFLASDVPAFLEHTKKVIFLDDNELIELSKGYAVYNATTKKLKKKKITTANLSVEQAEKGNFSHFMLKEIMEQKQTFYDALAQEDRQLKQIARLIKNSSGTYIIGCGTAGRVALAGTYFFSRIAKQHIHYAVGSEFPRYKDFINSKNLLIAISQSGETADTLEAIETAKAKGCKIVSIVNVRGSTMARTSDYVLYLNAGVEKAVAATKSATSQMAILMLLAFACKGKLNSGKKLLKKTADAINKTLNTETLKQTQKLAKLLKKREHIYIIGRSFNYPMAMEATIKLQEVAYIHAEGFAAGELKHGPIALIEKGTPCIALVGNDESKADILSNAIEIKSRGGYIIGISSEANKTFDFHIQVPDFDLSSPIINIIPVQLLSYYLSVLRGNDPDKPRNLAKSVTVK